MKTRFDLEQEILDCWHITTDLDDLYNFIGDSSFFEDMSPAHKDELMNLLLGLKAMYNIKFDRTFNTFEECGRKI
jgi:hypothetical protein